MKTFLKIVLIVGAVALFIHAISYSANRQEKKECYNWQNQAQIYPSFYLLEWQKQQCDHWGIDVLPKPAPQEPKNEPGEGLASWYDYDLRTSDQRCLEENEPCHSQVATTCASRDYPRGSVLKVSYPQPLEADGLFHPYFYKAITCLVNDYGPADKSRIIDLSSYAFGMLAEPSLGLIRVKVEFLE